MREREERLWMRHEARLMRQARRDALAIVLLLAALCLGAWLARWFAAVGGM
jgi:hypothetical protein